MTPGLRTHLVTAGLFGAVVVVVLLVWSLRNVFLYVLLAAVALLVYWGLYLVVRSRLRSDGGDESERHEPARREDEER